MSVSINGILLAALSAGIASGVGCVTWYAELPSLQTTFSATVQLCFQEISFMAGDLFHHIPIILRFLIIAVFIVGGILVTTLTRGIHSR